MLLTPILCIAAFSSDPIEDPVLTAMRALGVERESEPGEAAHLRRTIILGELGGDREAQTDASTPNIRFSELPWGSGFLVSTDPEGRRLRHRNGLGSALIEKIEAPLWEFTPPELVLVQDGDTARGTVRIAHAPTPGAPEAALATLLEFQTACGLKPEFELPLQVSAEGIELEFLWDMRKASEVSKSSIMLTSKKGRVPELAVNLVAADPVIVVPEFIAFDATGEEALEIDVSPGSEELRALEVVQTPACVHAEVAASSSGPGVLQVRETGVASGRHVCGSIFFKLKRGLDSIPFEGAVQVRHTTPLRADDGVPVLGVRAYPGEVLEVFRSPAGVLRLVHTGRVRSTRELLLGHGYEALASVAVPVEGRSFVADLDVAGSGLRVHVVIDPHTAEALPAWDQY